MIYNHVHVLMLILMELLLDYTSANTATVLLHCESKKNKTPNFITP